MPLVVDKRDNRRTIKVEHPTCGTYLTAWPRNKWSKNRPFTVLGSATRRVDQNSCPEASQHRNMNSMLPTPRARNKP